MNEYRYTAADLAAEFGVHVKTIRRRVAQLGIGIDFGGRAGRRFSDADRVKLIESMKPEAPVARKRRRAA